MVWSLVTCLTQLRLWSVSKPIVACGLMPWWQAGIRCLGSTRCRWLGIARSIIFRVPSLTGPMPSCLLIWFVPAARTTVRLTVTAMWLKRPGVLARSHQNLIWERQRHLNGLRSRLRDYYPAGVALLTALPQRDAVAVLGRAPTPDVGRRLTKPQIKAALKKGGRQRCFEPRVDEVYQILGTKHLDTPPVVADAFGAATTATVSIITTIDAQIAELANALEQCFKKHSDAAIYLSLPGIGDVIGARVLGEFGDDPNRYATAKSRRNYAGTSPLTKQSGRKKIVMARWIRKRRLYDAIDQWALTACNTSPGAKALNNHRRAQGDGHHQALRAVGNRLVGFLHGCLKTRTLYDENIAWRHQGPTAIKKAA